MFNFRLPIAAMLTICLPAVCTAHLDTLTQVMTPDPLVTGIEAEAATTVGKVTVVDEPKATGGKVAIVEGIGSGFKVDFGKQREGMYAVYVTATVLDPTAAQKAFSNQMLVSSDVQLKPLYLQLDINSGNNGEMESHRVRVPYPIDGQYEYIGKIYFHAPAERVYAGSVTLAHGSLITQLHVDRIELRNPLGALQFKAIKTRRMMFNSKSLPPFRVATAKEGNLPEPLRPRPLSAQARRRLDDIIWNQSVMPLNANPDQVVYASVGKSNPHVAKLLKEAEEKLGKPLGQWEMPPTVYNEPWVLRNKALGLEYTMADYNAGRTLPSPWPFPEDKGAYYFDKDQWGTEVSFNYGIVPLAMQQRYQAIMAALGYTHHARSSISNLPQRYLLLGDVEAASDAAFLLAAFAYRYPSYDWNLTCMVNIYQPTRTFNPGVVQGRGTSYQGWSTKDIVAVIQAYDALFPYIQDNQEFADRVGAYVPWVKTPADVIKLIDTFLVQRAAQDAVDMVLYSYVLPAAAVVLGANETGERYLDRYFEKGVYMRDSLSSFNDFMIGGYSRDGLNYIGSTYYTIAESITELMEVATLMRTYADNGGNKRYNINDVRQHPRLGAMADSVLGLFIAGGHRIGVGDVGDPQLPLRGWGYLSPENDRDFYHSSWEWTRDPRIAWILANKVGQGTATDKAWQAIRDTAAQIRDPMLHTTSRVVEGFGVAAMEENADSADPRLKFASMLRFGIGSGHAHPDTLDLEVFAHGIRMSADMGGRLSGQYGRPTCMSTKVHNLVEVDDAEFNNGPQNSTATGWITAFKPLPHSQYAEGAATAVLHPQVSQYQRGVLQVVSDPGNTTNLPTRGYLFDVFRVAGGKVHTWNFHGCVSEKFEINAELNPAQSPSATAYLARHRPETKFESTAGDALTATWTLRRTAETVAGMNLKNAEQTMLGQLYDPKSPIKLTRVTLLGRKGDHVMVGNWYADRMSSRHLDIPLLHVRRESDKDLHSVYPSIIEPFAGESIIKSMQLLAIEGAGDSADRPVAAKVVTTLGQTDLLYSGKAGEPARKIEADATMSGQSAMISTDAQGLRLLSLVGGTTVSHGQISVTAKQPAYATTIRKVNFGNQTATLAQSLPARLLDGETFTIHNADRTTTYVADEVKNDQIKFRRTASLYRGGVEYRDENGMFAVLDLAPFLQSYHPKYYNGVTVVNEAGQIIGKGRVNLGDRFFYLGWPTVRRHLNQIDKADLTDANGDGKITVGMYPNPAEDNTGKGARRINPDGEGFITVPVGEKMLDLEVTRLREDGLMIYTRQHPREFVDSLGQTHPGWPYHQQLIRNEAGTKEWTVNMPGDTYQLALDGKTIAAGDLPDSNGDGRAVVMLYDFGPGDHITVPTHVHLRRVAANTYELRANVQAAIRLPGTAASVSADQGKTWSSPANVQTDKGTVTWNVTDEELTNGPLLVRVK